MPHYVVARSQVLVAARDAEYVAQREQIAAYEQDVEGAVQAGRHQVDPAG